MDLMQLPLPLIRDIFLLIPLYSVKASRLVCKAWNNFIVKILWESDFAKCLLKQKLDRNWNIQNPMFQQREIIRNLYLNNLYIIHATHEKLILQDIQNMNHVHQFLWIYDLNENQFWRTDLFGPVKIKNILQSQNTIPVKVQINKTIFSIVYESEANVGYQQSLMVWSTSSRELLYEKIFHDFCLISFLPSSSTIVILNISEIVTMDFNCFGMKSEKKNHHNFNMNEENVEGCRICENFLILWQQSDVSHLETKFFVWEIEDTPTSKLQIESFKNFAGMRIQSYDDNLKCLKTDILLDALFQSSNIILLVQERIIEDMGFEDYCLLNERMKTYIKVINNDGIILREFQIKGEPENNMYFTNGQFIYNENRLIVKLTGSRDDTELFMMDLSQHPVSYKFLDFFEEKTDSYKYDNFYPTQYSNKHGYFVTTNIIGIMIKF